MRIGGAPGRAERARVARRVRALLSSDESEPEVDGEARGEGTRADGANRGPRKREIGGRQGGWLPAEEFEQAGRQPPQTASALRRVRWDPSRRAAAAMGLAVVVVVALTLSWLLVSRPHALAVAGSGPVPASSAATSSASASSPPARSSASGAPSASGAVVVVDVAGKVRRPGIYRLPPGSRVFDALRAAGGVRTGVSTTSLNLAAPLSDGEQIIVGLAGGSQVAATLPGTSAGGAGAAGRGPSGSAGSSGPVRLNTATLEQLETLPGVGPVLGQHILDWRDAHGHFATVDQLREVPGIGPVKFASLRGLVAP